MTRQVVSGPATVQALKEGDSVKNFPEYSQPIKTSEGSEVVLSNFIGQSPVVLFFYPKVCLDSAACLASI